MKQSWHDATSPDLSRQIYLTQWKLMEWGICDDHRTGILQPCDKHISIPVHTPAKISFLPLSGHLDMPLPWFSALVFCRTYCKFSCQGSSETHFSSYWRIGMPCFYLACSALPIPAIPRSSVFIPPNKYIDCIRKRNLKII